MSEAMNERKNEGENEGKSRWEEENQIEPEPPVEIPSVVEVRKIMRSLSESLYEAWKEEIADRLRHLEFEGCICREHILVPNEVWRLPNDEVRYALCKLEEDLRSLGYDYEFKFNDVDDVHWVMFYSITLPERDEYDSETDNARTINSVESDLDFAY